MPERPTEAETKVTPGYPPHPRLAGARVKLKRARDHLELIQQEVGRVTGPGAYSIHVSREDHGRKHIWRIEGLKTLDPMLPLWIGDCLHNLRSAFDHIAYIIHPGPNHTTTFPLLAEKPERPLYINPAPGPHVEAIKIVESIQPYNTGGEHNPLASCTTSTLSTNTEDF